jgi:hypothetical protein
LVTLGRPIFVIPKRYAVTEQPKISDTRHHEEKVSDTLPPSLRIARCPSPRVSPAAVVRRSSDLLLLLRPPLIGKDSFSAPRPAASHQPSSRPPRSPYPRRVAVAPQLSDLRSADQVEVDPGEFEVPPSFIRSLLVEAADLIIISVMKNTRKQRLLVLYHIDLVPLVDARLFCALLKY